MGGCTAVQPACVIVTEARWRSGDAPDCKSVYAGSIPARASNDTSRPIHPAQGCSNAPLAPEAWRQRAATRAAFRDGMERLIERAAPGDDPPAKDRATMIFAAIVGGLALSRAIRDGDSAASGNILRAVASQVQALS